MALVPGELGEALQNLVPDDGVETAGGLVQKQEPGAVAQGHGNGQLHLHTPGEVLEALLPRQGEPVHIAGVGGLVPAGIGLSHHLTHLPGVEDLREVGLIQHHADVIFQFPEGVGAVVLAQDGDLAAVPGDGIHNEPQRGGFARAVFAHQTHDAAGGQRQGQILQGEGGVGFGHMAQFDCVVHGVSSWLMTR